MKQLLLLVLLVAVFVAGCASRYQIVLTNGTILTTNSRPKLDKATNSYTYKDAKGKTVVIPSGRIREIAPLSHGEKPDKFHYN
jgi:ABC-type Fe3+-hydroxamate transport system substrate-binding protein